MTRQTNIKSATGNNQNLVATAVIFIALIASACGGEAPTNVPGENLAPADSSKSLDRPGHQVLELKDAPGASGVDLAGAQPRLLGEEPRLDQPAPAPKLDIKQVLQLCGDGVMTVRNTLVDQKLAGDFTLELWFEAKTIVDQTIVQASNLSIRIKDGRVAATIAGQAMTGLNVVEREWYHVALVVKKDAMTLFVNGLPLSITDSADGWARPAGTLTFGGSTDESHAFCGSLENIRLTGQSLYQSHFTPSQKLAKLDAAAFSYDFDDMLGPEIEDMGYYNVDGKLSGDARLVEDSI